ncbi:Delta 1-pyrroline-5-carboxylate synthetase [Trichuris trichiura]|uniref:Delta 1-pyrroline-5-carboxylate synthetase n=1 Tax=Trichuris trichiura TaxID=36087 RepID=A0A077YXN3_TRITR|nr:Delta 1-pyrroline-5-carboxylate synthetase [Trichuris trichiura]
MDFLPTVLFRIDELTALVAMDGKFYHLDLVSVKGLPALPQSLSTRLNLFGSPWDIIKAFNVPIVDDYKFNERPLVSGHFYVHLAT